MFQVFYMCVQLNLTQNYSISYLTQNVKSVIVFQFHYTLQNTVDKMGVKNLQVLKSWKNTKIAKICKLAILAILCGYFGYFLGLYESIEGYETIFPNISWCSTTFF